MSPRKFYGKLISMSCSCADENGDLSSFGVVSTFSQCYAFLCIDLLQAKVVGLSIARGSAGTNEATHLHNHGALSRSYQSMGCGE